MELKRLKRKVLDVYQYDKDNMTMPTENNELKVETDRSSTKDRLTRGYTSLSLLERQFHRAYFQEPLTKRWLVESIAP